MSEPGKEGVRTSERAGWDLPMRKLNTPLGTQSLGVALDLYAPHTSDEIDENPGLKLDIAKKAAPHIEAAIQGFIIALNKEFAPKGLLTIDWLTYIRPAIEKAILFKYPEYAVAGLRYGEAFVFNEIIERIEAYFIAKIVANEREHRQMTKKGQPVHEIFFYVVDNMMVLASRLSREEFAKLDVIVKRYRMLKQLWLPLFRERNGKLANPTGKDREKLKKDNDQVAKFLLAEGARDLPMCTVDNNTLLRDKNLVMQFAPIDDPQLGVFSMAIAQVDYFTEEVGAEVRGNVALQEKLRPKLMPEGGPGIKGNDYLANKGAFPATFVRRFSGELQGVNAGPEALKVLAGSGPAYELLRRDIFWYLSQLTCRRATLEKMYGDTFTRRKKGLTDGGAPVVPGIPDPNPEPNPSTEATRFYPGGNDEESFEQRLSAAAEYFEGGVIAEETTENGSPLAPEDVEEAVDDTVERVVRETAVVGHRKLLPLLRRVTTNADGSETISYHACKPSQRAIQSAADKGKELRCGVEIVGANLVFGAEEMAVLFKQFGVATLEELVALHPEEIYVRYETWVPPYKRGDSTHGVIETIRARVQDQEPE